MEGDLLRCMRELEDEIASDQPAKRSNAVRRMAIHMVGMERKLTELDEEVHRVRLAVLGQSNTDPEVQEGGLLGAHRRISSQIALLRRIVVFMFFVLVAVVGALTWGLSTLQRIANTQTSMIEYVQNSMFELGQAREQQRKNIQR